MAIPVKHNNNYGNSTLVMDKYSPFDPTNLNFKGEVQSSQICSAMLTNRVNLFKALGMLSPNVLALYTTNWEDTKKAEYGAHPPLVHAERLRTAPAW
jgi:hypothetical protein